MLFQLLNGIVKGHHILMNVTGQPQDLLFAVQNFNALCVWVVAGSEWARNGGRIGPVGGHEEGGEEEEEVVRVVCIERQGCLTSIY